MAVFSACSLGQTIPAKIVTPRAPTNQVVITDDMIEIKTIKLDESAVNHQLSPVLVANDPRGGMWIAWQTGGSGYRIQHLDNSLAPDREAVKLQTNAVMGLYGHIDGSLAFTWFNAQLKREFGVDLYLTKISPTGKMIFNTKVRGDPGAGLEYVKRPVGFWNHPDFQGPTVPIAYNGKQYGLFYVVLQKFQDLACHTGDEFVSVDKNGKVDEKSRSTWNASHSFWQSTVVGMDDQFYGITLSDPYPVPGIRMGSYSRKPVAQSIVWPRKTTPAFPPDTKISAAFKFKAGFAMAISTAIPKEIEDLPSWDQKLFDSKVKGPGAYPVLLMFDKSGKKAKATYITDLPAQDMIITGGALGWSYIAVLWATGPAGMDKGTVFGAYPTKMAILDPSGKVLQSPIEIKAPLTWHSDATTLSNGDLVWGAVADDWTPVDDARKLYIVRVRCRKPALPKPETSGSSATNSIPAR